MVSMSIFRWPVILVWCALQSAGALACTPFGVPWNEQPDEIVFVQMPVVAKGRVLAVSSGHWWDWFDDPASTAFQNEQLVRVRIEGAAKGFRDGEVIDIPYGSTPCGGRVYAHPGDVLELRGRRNDKGAFVEAVEVRSEPRFDAYAAAYAKAKAFRTRRAVEANTPAAYRELVSWLLRHGDVTAHDAALDRVKAGRSWVQKMRDWFSGAGPEPRKDFKQARTTGDYTGLFQSYPATTGLAAQGTAWRRSVFLGGTLSGADLRDADLTEAGFLVVRMDGANVGFARANGASFIASNLSNLRGHGLSAAGAVFDEATLTGANLANADLRRASFRGAALGGVSLKGAQLEGADFLGATIDCTTQFPGQVPPGVLVPSGGCGTQYVMDLRGIDGLFVPRIGHVRNYILGHRDLTGADLSGVNLGYANLEGSTLDGANLTGAYVGDGHSWLGLTQVSARYANLTAISGGLNLRKADLTGARISGVGSSARPVIIARRDGKLDGATIEDVDVLVTFGHLVDLTQSLNPILSANLRGVRVKCDVSSLGKNSIPTPGSGAALREALSGKEGVIVDASCPG